MLSKSCQCVLSKNQSRSKWRTNQKVGIWNLDRFLHTDRLTTKMFLTCFSKSKIMLSTLSKRAEMQVEKRAIGQCSWLEMGACLNKRSCKFVVCQHFFWYFWRFRLNKDSLISGDWFGTFIWRLEPNYISSLKLQKHQKDGYILRTYNSARKSEPPFPGMSIERSQLLLYSHFCSV